MTEPHWKGRAIAAAAMARKAAAAIPKQPRDFIREAFDAVGFDRSIKYEADRLKEFSGLIGPVIIAQAIDRLTEKLSEAAAISNYKRS